MSAEDDEFVARAGQLWTWIDNAMESATKAGTLGALLLMMAGVSFWLALALTLLPVAVVTQTAVVLERRRIFPPESEES